MSLINKKVIEIIAPNMRKLSSSTSLTSDTKNKIVIIGGGSGGCSLAAKFSRKMDPSKITLIDSAETHYYQPMWTLVGGGIKKLSDSGRAMSKILPKNINWIKNKVESFEPSRNRIKLENGQIVEYDYLVVGIGIELKFDQIKGLTEALKSNSSGVCSNYSPLYVEKTWDCIQKFKKGNAIFTFPNSPVKCPGAPQKILYLAEDYFRKNGLKEDAKIIYNTSLPVLFGVKKYADALWKIVEARNIEVNLRRNLIHVEHEKKMAHFQNLDNSTEIISTKYEILHVTPPMAPPSVLKNSGDKSLVDSSGFLDVLKSTLQHKAYENIFGIGDCTNSPNSKTAAAVAAQSVVVFHNLMCLLNNRKIENFANYDGYASCPLITSSSKCILAEFDYNLAPLETFPINQAKERVSMFHLKKHILPFIYWNFMMRGYWNGPAPFRKLMHLGMK